jgi:hypothetical protein
MISFPIRAVFFKIGAILSWLFVAAGGLFHYTGSSIQYIIFSIVFLYLLFDGVSRRISLGYTFLVIFLWLGFWLKLVVHLFLDYKYLEPIGYFDGTPEMWDSVLTISTVGATAIITTKKIYAKYVIKHAAAEVAANFHAPTWYPIYRPWLWSLAFILVIFIPIINSFYGIAQLGLVPLLLPWPLTGLMAWFLSFGLIAMVLTLTGWDNAIGRGWGIGLFGVILEGFTSSVTSFSRAAYLFHTLPYMIALFGRRSSIQSIFLSAKVLIFSIWIFVFIISLSAVTLLRHSNILYIVGGSETSSIKGSSDQYIELNKLNFDGAVNLGSVIFQRISHLVVDRWIGIEGVMAVVAYPKKNIELFVYALQERRVRGKSDIYTSNISQSGFFDADAKKYQYASIPGPIAFFYYTGSLLLLVVGVVILLILMLVSERAVYLLTKNMYLCAFWSMNIAQMVASFGLGVVQSVTYYFTCFIAMVFIWILQKKYYFKSFIKRRIQARSATLIN